MKRIVLNLHASYDPDANSTYLDAYVRTFEGEDFSHAVAVELHEVRQEILWDDRHDLTVNTRFVKALTRWAEACYFVNDPF